MIDQRHRVAAAMGATVLPLTTSFLVGLAFQAVLRVVDVDPEAVAGPWRVVITMVVAVPVAVVAYRALIERSA